jgi:hypothetical protein
VSEAIGHRGRHLGVAQVAIATLTSKDRPITGRHLFRHQAEPGRKVAAFGKCGPRAYSLRPTRC